MGLRTVLDGTSNLLKANGYDNRVGEWAYDLLEGADAPITIILNGGGSTGPDGNQSELMDYGTERLRYWQITFEVFSTIGAAVPADAHVNLVTAIDHIVGLVEQYPYLGLGKDAGVDAEIIEISDFSLATSEEGSDNFITATLIMDVKEQSGVITELE
jgi:hypothetical protein